MNKSHRAAVRANQCVVFFHLSGTAARTIDRAAIKLGELSRRARDYHVGSAINHAQFESFERQMPFRREERGQSRSVHQYRAHSWSRAYGKILFLQFDAVAVDRFGT